MPGHYVTPSSGGFRRPAPIIGCASILIGDNIMPTDESEPELFVELMYRFMSAKHRQRVAVNDIVGTTHFVLQQHKPAYFVMQEATDDLEKIYTPRTRGYSP
jgi:hypothetical protein